MEQTTAIQEMDETAKRREAERLKEAVKLVNEAISKRRAMYDKIARTDDQSPIALEGETSKGVYVQAMVDPNTIYLKYDYPTAVILDDEASQGMWDDLAELVGLASCCSVDL